MSENGAKTAHMSASPLDPEFTRLYDIKNAKFILNLIVDRAGGYAPPGASKELTNPRDRQLFHHLRAQCDAIIIGAETARTEPYRNHTKQIVVLTQTGIFPDDFFSGVQPWILTDEPSLLRVTKEVRGRAEIFTYVDFRELTDFFITKGIASILCEGGAIVASLLSSHDLFDLVFLTRTNTNALGPTIEIDTLTQGVPSLSEITEEGTTYQRHERRLR